VDHIVFAHNGTNVMTTSNKFDNLNRLTGISSASSASSASSVVNSQYQYNAAGQRTRVTLVDGSYWLYGYDALGQVTSAVKYFWDGTPYPGQQFGFGFDTIGSRLSTRAGGNSNGANLRLANYTNNALNQITSRDVPGYVDVMGLTLATNIVQVNGTNAYQKSQYFREQMGTNNSTAPQWVGINVTAPGEAAITGDVFLARTPETNFLYDLDGNQTRDGRFTNTWDAENRLIGVASLPGAPAASQYSNVFTYDYMGRRIQKVVSTNGGSGWAVPSTNEYVYDGWNLMAILDAPSHVLYAFTWGTDLSGTMQGAGGVGGLLSMTVCAGPNAGTYFYCYDGNGNVVALVNAANGTIAANYEYGPFGELIRATGPMAKVNPFMFSTKFYDWETGLYYYGCRYYNPSTGRWPSRDPIGEKGGKNLYGFVGNQPLSRIDLLGLINAYIIFYYDPGNATLFTKGAQDHLKNIVNIINGNLTQDKLMAVFNHFGLATPDKLGLHGGETSIWLAGRCSVEFGINVNQVDNSWGPAGVHAAGYGPGGGDIYYYPDSINECHDTAIENGWTWNQDIVIANIVAHESLAYTIDNWTDLSSQPPHEYIELNHLSQDLMKKEGSIMPETIEAIIKKLGIK